MIRVFEPWISFSNIVEVNKALFKNQISGSSIYVKNLKMNLKNLLEWNTPLQFLMDQTH